MRGGPANLSYVKPGEIVKEEIIVSARHVLSVPDQYIIPMCRFDSDSKIYVKSNAISITVTN